MLEDFFLDLANQTPEQWIGQFFRTNVNVSDESGSGSAGVSERTLRVCRDTSTALSQGVSCFALQLFGLALEDDQPMFRDVAVSMLSFPHYEQNKLRQLDRLRALRCRIKRCAAFSAAATQATTSCCQRIRRKSRSCDRRSTELYSRNRSTAGCSPERVGVSNHHRLQA